MRAVEGMESPNATDGSSDFTIKIGRFESVGFDHEPAALGIGLRREIDGRTGLGLDVQYQIMRKFGGEDERSAFRRKHQLRLASTQDLVWLNDAERWWWRCTDRGQPEDDHGFWISERWRIVKA